MSAILPARSLPIPGSSVRSLPCCSRLRGRLRQALELARGAAIGAHAKLVLALDFQQFGGLVEHRSDFSVLHRHARTPATKKPPVRIAPHDCCDRLALVVFDLPLQAPGLVLQPPARPLEGIVDGEQQVGVPFVGGCGAPDIDLAALRQR